MVHIRKLRVKIEEDPKIHREFRLYGGRGTDLDNGKKKYIHYILN